MKRRTKTVFLGKRAAKVVAVAAAFAAVVVLLGTVLGRKGRPIERIVLVTLDTLRADHVGCYGYPRDTTPFLDRFAAEGVRFEHAYAIMSTTSPAHASIFTGLYPGEHGVLKNGHVLDESFVTMAELMRGMGYRTAAFVSTDVHFKAGQMDQGFEVLDEPWIRDFGLGYRRGDATVDRAIEWLETCRSDDAIFLWVHLFDPHTPCHPPPEYLKRVSGDGEAHAKFLTEEHRVDMPFFDNDVSKMMRTINDYDAEVLLADEQTKRLYRYFAAARLDTKSLWIVIADHGEGLGNHAFREHGKHLYVEQIHVPLLFRFSDGRLKGSVVDGIVEQVDVLPTLLELVGEAAKETSGRSFAGLLAPGNGKRSHRKTAFAQRRQYDPLDRPEDVEETDANYEEGEKYSLQDSTFKYILRTEGPDEFYNSETDPYEIDNLAGKGMEEEEKLRAALMEKIAGLKGMGRKAKLADRETLDKLRAIGYIQ